MAMTATVPWLWHVTPDFKLQTLCSALACFLACNVEVMCVLHMYSLAMAKGCAAFEGATNTWVAV